MSEHRVVPLPSHHDQPAWEQDELQKGAKAGFKPGAGMQGGGRELTAWSGLAAQQDGRLQVLKHLGRGSSANVMQCSFSSMTGKQMVAKKQIRTELLGDPQEVRTFLAEVKLLRTLNHKYIVQFYGCGWPQEAEEGDHAALGHQLFFLQEYMAGGTLHQMVLKAMTSKVGKKVYSNADVLRWALQIAQALEYLHSHDPKVIHRDLKLENVLLTSTNPTHATAKLADFGLARRLQGSAGVMAGSADHMQLLINQPGKPTPQRLDTFTRTSSDELECQLEACMPRNVMGTGTEEAHPTTHMTERTGSMGYMAPEVLQGKPYNEKADVFSFAIILYNLIHRDIPTLHVVLNGDTEDLEEYAHNVAHGYRPAIATHVPASVRSMIERCWKGMPELRPDMSQVVAELQAMQMEVAEPAEPALDVGSSQREQAGEGGKACCTIM